MNSTILIVDDTEENIDILVDMLHSNYNLLVALDGMRAIELVHHNHPDLILLDVMMPGVDGYEVCRRLKQSESTQNIPIIFLTALAEEKDEIKGIELGAVDFIRKPFNPMIVKSRIRNNILAKTYQNKLEHMVKERTLKVEKTKDVIIKAMGRLAEFRDPETGAHILRTQRYVLILAHYLKDKPGYSEFLTDEIIEAMFKSAPLHDVGKIAISDTILQKPGPLTPEEFEVMKGHALQGKLAIDTLREDLPEALFVSCASEIAYNHHEKWDGSGYPRGLVGEDIPICGRIMALADVYDALISARVYKPAFSHEKARQIILAGNGTHFDPVVIEAFLALEEDFKTIASQYKD